MVQTDETPIFIPSLGWTSFDPRGSVVLCVVFDEPKKLAAKQAAGITLRDHAKLWTQYVVRARELIGQADTSKGQECPHLIKLKVGVIAVSADVKDTPQILTHMGFLKGK